jgi:hypothetical protein
MTVLRAIIIALLSLTSCSLGTKVKAVPAYPSDDFVERVGVNVHLPSIDSPYAQSWERTDRKDVKTLLSRLGVRHIRSGFVNPQFHPNTFALPRFAYLYETAGIKLMTGSDFWQDGKLASGSPLEQRLTSDLNFFANGKINSGKRSIPVVSLLSGVEGPNEYDSNASRDPFWINHLRQYQVTLYQRIKSNPVLKQLPILMPSMKNAKSCDSLGNIETMIDFANLHSYPAYPYWRNPGAEFGWHLGKVKGCAGKKPVIVTETGYSTFHSMTSATLSEEVMAKYIPRLLAEYYQSGVSRTYLYEFSDFPHHSKGRGETQWGLVKATTVKKQPNGFFEYRLEPKKQYVALQQLLALLNESRWDGQKLSFIRPKSFQPRPLNITFVKKKSTTDYLLFQKSTGEYFLLLWQEVENHNPSKGNFAVPADQVVLQLGGQFQRIIQHSYKQDFSFAQKDMQMPGGNWSSSLTIDVPDSITVLQLVPNSKQSNAEAK